MIKQPASMFIFLLLNEVYADSTPYASITSLAGYKSLRACAQGCIYHDDFGCVGDSIGQLLSCTYSCSNFAWDGCYCRPDLQTDAESFLSKCVSSACTIGDVALDVSAVVSLYDGYCISAGYTALRAPKVVTATTTIGNQFTGTTNVVASGAQLTPASQPTGTVYVTIVRGSDGGTTTTWVTDSKWILGVFVALSCAILAGIAIL
jgi:hypothetical protein